MSDTVLSQLQQHKTLIIGQLETFIAKKSPQFSQVNEWGTDSLERLLEFSKKGKMIRGSLLLLTTELFGQKITTEHLKAAAALELIQSALLIHDDIIDQDALRRGKPSMHTQLQTVGLKRNLTNSAQFGTSLALCVGDVGFFLAFELINSLKILPEIKTQLTRLLLEEIQLVELAEMQDVFFSATDKPVSRKEILKLYQYKTGRYTFSLPLACSALLTRQPNSTVKILIQLGENLGILFQIKDDELSLFGTTDTTGKPVGTDISRNNKTLYHYYLFRQAAPVEHKKLEQIFGKPDLTKVHLDLIRKLITQLEITEKINAVSSKLETEAQTIIQALPVSLRFKKHFQELITLNQNRSK